MNADLDLMYDIAAALVNRLKKDLTFLSEHMNTSGNIVLEAA